MADTAELPPYPLGRKQEKFVNAIVHGKDAAPAAIEAGYTKGSHARLLKNPRVRGEIERRKNLILAEEAKIEAKRRSITREKLDTALMEVVEADIKETPQVAASKVRAIEIGYEAIGASVEGVFIPEAPTQGAQPSNPQEPPRIFRATEARIITHIIETTQEVTHRELSQGAPPEPQQRAAPKVIQASAQTRPASAEGYKF